MLPSGRLGHNAAGVLAKLFEPCRIDWEGKSRPGPDQTDIFPPARRAVKNEPGFPRCIAAKAIVRFKDRIRELTGRHRGVSLQAASMRSRLGQKTIYA
jgi:hypothetical protein